MRCISLTPISTICIFFVIIFTSNIHAQTSTLSNSSLVSGANPIAYTTVNQDGNSRVWQSETYEQGADGQTIPRIHQYTELATGLNHLVNGQWVDSEEEIEMLPDGTAEATNGQHQVYFPGDIYNGQIELVTPDGIHLKSRPVGLSYDDGNNTVLIAVLTNSVGYLADSNQIVYPNAFAGLAADLRYTYTRSGLEQDVILHEQPPVPASLNLNSGTTRMQVLTEFFDPPQPQISTTTVSTPAGETPDQQLGFGVMQMGHGKAFLINTTDRSVLISKQWVRMNGRQMLVESVPLASVTDELETLPQPVNQAKLTMPTRTIARHVTLPPSQLVGNVPNHHTKLLAKVRSTQGFVLDYQMVNENLTNYTFQAGATYYISGLVGAGGTTMIEGGAVIKYASGGIAILNSPTQESMQPNLISTATPDNMAILTSVNDNTVGATINGSSGNPTNTGVGYLSIYLYSTASTLNSLRFMYAGTAISQFSSVDSSIGANQVSNSQFINCNTAIILGDYNNSTILNQGLYNVLFSNCGTVVKNGNAEYYGSEISMFGQNITADQVTNLLATWANDRYSTGSRFTNSILTAITHQIFYMDTNISYSVGTNDCFITNIDAGVYQAGPQGNYYLPTNSPHINAGNGMAAAEGFADSTTQTNQAPDTGVVDLGYHYPAFASDSSGTDFWLTFFNLIIENYQAPYYYADLLLYISSQTATTATVTFPINGPTLTITGDPAVNGTYILTNTPEAELEAQDDIDATMYVNSTNNALQVVSFSSDPWWAGLDYWGYGEEWEVLSYDIASETAQGFYYKFDFNLNGNNWQSYEDDSFDTNLVICCPQIPFSQSVSLTPGEVTNVPIPLSVMLADFDAVESKGIHVTAGQPVSVYGFDYLTYLSTAFTAYPTPLLGTNYCLMSRASFDASGESSNSAFAIVATVTNTTVTITPSATANLTHAGIITLTLQPGETYEINSSDIYSDVTGTQVTSDNPIAVFAGVNAADVPSGNTPAANPLLQEQLPTAEWGTNVLSLGFAFRANGDSYRILSAVSNTVTIQGIVVTLNDNGTVTTNYETIITNLAAGQFYDMITEGPVQFQSLQPIQVAQFANGAQLDDSFNNGIGDPCEILLSPVGQYLNSYTVATPSQSDFNTNIIAEYGMDWPLFNTNYLNLIVTKSAIPEVSLDGQIIATTNFIAIGSSGYYGAQLPVTNGVHQVNSSQPVEVQVYGFNPSDAYGYFGGIVQ